MATRKRTPPRSAGSLDKRGPKTVKSKQRAAPTQTKPGTVTTRPLNADAGAEKPIRRRSANPLAPYLTVMDAAASLAFYARAFGFEPGVTVTSPSGEIIHAVMHYRGAVAIMLSPEGIWSGTMQAPVHSGAENPIILYVHCPKVDELTARARAAGARILSEPTDMFWGDRIARIADPDGYVWCFAAKVGKFDPAKMPQLADENPAPVSGLDIEF